MDCNDTERMQFILDCTVLPDAIDLQQRLGKMVHDSLLTLPGHFVTLWTGRALNFWVNGTYTSGE